MKIEFDFDNKILRLTSPIKYGELKKKMKTLKRFAPDIEDWTIDTNVSINWGGTITPYWQPLAQEHFYVTSTDGITRSNGTNEQSIIIAGSESSIKALTSNQLLEGILQFEV